MSTKNQTTITADPGKQEMFITREFDAPRELVFKTFIDPKLLVQWLGPRDLTMKMEKFEAKTGGSWRFIHSRNEHAYGFNGVFHEIAPPERIIRTFEFEGMPEKGHVSIETARFEVLPGNRTKLIIHSVFQSAADRDGMIQSGMEKGMNEGFERLEELMEKELVA